MKKKITEKYGILLTFADRIETAIGTAHDSTDKLSAALMFALANVEAMRQLQEDEGKRLKAIENRDGEMWRRMLSYAATAIVGVLIGFIFSQLGIE